MGWPFDEASWNGVEGAYYTAMGAEMFWFLASLAICLIALVVGSKHELDAYKREEEKSGN
jgi:hypothetical protein